MSNGEYYGAPRFRGKLNLRKTHLGHGTEEPTAEGKSGEVASIPKMRGIKSCGH
jgi:hypothetical protein